MENEKYYRDNDDSNLIVRVWYNEDGERCGEFWYIGKSKDWARNDDLAWMVADDIYNNHPLSEKEAKRLTAE